MSTPVSKSSYNEMAELSSQHKTALSSLAKAISADEKSKG